MTEQDAKIAGIAHDRGKGVIVAVNKWDAVEKNDKTIYEYTKKIRDTLSFMQYAEMRVHLGGDGPAAGEAV